MSHYTLTTVGLASKDIAVIKSLLRLFQKRLTAEWELLYYQPALVVIYDPEQEHSNDLAALAKPGALKLCYTDEAKPGIPCLSKPIKASQFIEVLNHFTQQPTDTKHFSKAERVFDPDTYWLGAALKALSEKHAVCVRYLDLPPLWIDGEHQHYYSELALSALTPLHQAALSHLEITCLSTEAVLSQVNRLGLTAHPLNTLLWASTLSLSNGRLLKGHELNGVVNLTHWPDFSSLPHEANYLVIALKMIDGQFSLPQIAAETKIDLDPIVNLYNACAVIGLARQKSIQSTPEVLVIPRTIALFGFSIAEQKALATLMVLSKARRQSYTLVLPTESQSAPILLIDHSNPDALQQLAVHIAKTGNTNAVIIPVCNQRLVDETYCIIRPLTTHSVYSVLDQLPTATSANSTSQELPPRTALVVDDSLAVRIQLEQTLQQYDFKVTTTSTGEQALELTDNHHYDVIFLDVVMPGIDGYETCRQIKKDSRKKTTPVIMLTSKSSPFDKIKGKLAGCNAYLTKPVDKKIFQQAIAQYVPSTVIV